MKKGQKKPIIGVSLTKKPAKKNPVRRRRTHFQLPTIKRSNQKLIGLTGYKNRKYNLRIGQSKSEVVWLNSLEPVFGCKIDREKAVLGLPTVGNRREILVLDGYIPKGNIAFEFLGGFFHGDRRLYNPNDYCKMLKCTYGQLYAKTLRRFQTLHSLGYKVFFVWELDWKKGSRGKFWKPGELI